MKLASLCRDLVLASIRGQMQYRLNFLIEMAFGLVFSSIGFVFIWVVLGRFEAIGGWTLIEVALLYGMRLTSHGLWTVSFSRLFAIDRMVVDGEFDRMMIRPMPMMLQLMFGSFRIATLGDLLGGVVILSIALAQVPINWSVGKLLLLACALIGGAMLDGAFQLGPAAMTFRTLQSMPVRGLFDEIFGRFSGYPTSIFDRGARFLLMWIVPVAFVAWAPATVLLDRTDDLPFPGRLAWFSPLAGVVCIAIAAWLFVRESRHYQSSGS